MLRNGSSHVQVRKWGPQQRAQIEGLVGVHQDRIRSRQQQKQNLSREYPAAAKAVWLFTPPKPNASRSEYILKRLVTAPFRLDFLQQYVRPGLLLLSCSFSQNFPADASIYATLDMGIQT